MGLSTHLSGIGSDTRFNVVIETATLINQPYRERMR
jgi:hypothetical protein